ncbi:MAG TPA: PAS domain S-box protein [Azospirillum sp.]|nr:PAS domain S-box protein [Azospirillum sp.]
MRPLTILLWVSLVLPTMVAGAIVSRSYEERLQHASIEGRQTVSLLREHALRVFEVQEQAIGQIEARIAGMDWDAIEQSADVHALLKSIADESPHIDGVWLMRPEGRRVNSADFFPIPPEQVAEGEHFQVLKERGGTYLGRMIRDRLKGNLNFNLSRRRSAPDDRFDGVILVTTALSYFEEFWRGALTDPSHSVAIVRADGEILARFPGVKEVPSRLPADSPFFAATAKQDAGRYESRSSLDGRERLFSFAKLGAYPAFVIVGLDRGVVLASWLQTAAVVGALAAATSLLLVAVVRIARRHDASLSAEVLRRRYAESTLIAKEEHVAALKRAETALRTSEERFRSVYEQAAVGIKRLDLDGRIIDVNGMLCGILGYSRDELIGRSSEEIIEPADHAAEREPLRRLLAGEVDRYAIEKRYIRKDGGRVWVRVTSSLVHAGEEGPCRLAIVEDISRRQAVETALRNSEERFRRLFEAAPFAVMMIEPETLRMVAFNDQAPSILGYTRAEFARLTIADIEAESSCAEIVQAHSAIIAAGRRHAFETRLKGKSGALHDVIMSVQPVEIDGKNYIYSGIVDITDRRRIERELADAKETAEQANLAKSKFLAAASHDLRQPLQSLFLFAHVLRAQVGEGKARETLGALQKGLDAMKGLLDSLLDVSRLDAGSVTVDIRSVSVAELLDAIDTAYARIAANKGLSWTVESCTAVVHSDPTLLGQLLRNLIENAIRYTPHGAIRVACRKDGDTLHIEVHDTGVGIPSEHIDRIWEEFHQVGNPERDREKGLGLGLAIVRRLSELLEHPVTVCSEPGRGSVFTVAVPLDADDLQGEAAPPERTIQGHSGPARLVVVVEDDSIVLAALEALLCAWGYDVLAVSSGAEAVERISGLGRTPDLIVSDYRLRAGEVGTEAIRRIRQTCGQAVPGVLLTGETAVTALRDAADEGLLVVHKPVRPAELDDALRQQILADV